MMVVGAFKSCHIIVTLYAVLDQMTQIIIIKVYNFQIQRRVAIIVVV